MDTDVLFLKYKSIIEDIRVIRQGKANMTLFSSLSTG